MCMREKNLQILLKQAQTGDRTALSELVDSCQDRVFSFLLRLTNSRELAEELFQDTMLKAIRGLQKCQGEMKFLSWLFKIAHRLYLDHLRSAGRNIEVQVEDMALVEGNDSKNTGIAANRLPVTPDVVLLNKEFVEHLKRAESSLPELEKQVYLLYRHSGMTFADIAKMLGCPLNTVLSRMHRAMKELRRELCDWQEIKDLLVVNSGIDGEV